MNNDYKLVKNTEWKEVEVNGEITEIPTDWILTTIDQSFKVAGGGTPPTIEPSYWNGTISWLGPKEMSKEKGQYIGTGEKYISESGAKKLGNKKVLKDSVIISTRAPVGYIKFAKNDLYTNQGCHSLLPSKIISNGYIFYWLIKNKNILEQNASGTTFKELSSGNLKSIEFCYPPISKQAAIAEILSAQESIIQDIESLISKYESRFQYLSEELLSGKLRVKEVDGQITIYKNADDNWKEVEVNGEMKEIPMDWGMSSPKLLSFNIKTGKKDANAAKLTGRYPFFTCSANEILQIDSYNFDTEALIISGNGSTLGEVKYYKGKFDAYQRTYILDNIKNINFMFHYFKHSFKKSLNIIGGSIPFIKMDDLESFNILLPTDGEQILISSILDHQKYIIVQQKELFSREKKKFDWLLDNLLSGKYLVQDQ